MFSKYLKDNALEDMKSELKLLETISDKSNQLVNIEVRKLDDEQGIDPRKWIEKDRTRLKTMVHNNGDMLRDVKMLRDFIELTEKLSESEIA